MCIVVDRADWVNIVRWNSSCGSEITINRTREKSVTGAVESSDILLLGNAAMAMPIENLAVWF